VAQRGFNTVVQPPLYGLDIVTDTARGDDSASPTIDPATDRVLAVGLSLGGRDLLFDGDEPALLERLDDLLADLPAGVLVSWQGGLVDLPVLDARAERLQVDIALRIRRDPRDRRPSPLAGIEGAYCGSWHGHRHLDLARVYDPSGPRVIRALRGRSDEDLIPPTDELTSHDPRRDAQLARCLAERRWGRARRLVDRMPSTASTPSPAAPILAAVRSLRSA
jgi:hypothetical protein